MPTLLNQQFPYLRIYDPINDRMVEFRGGRLDIEADDPSYEAVMAEASRNPTIQVIATMQPVAADEPANVVVLKAATALACDVCVPAVAFSKADQLALHMKLLHAAGEEEEPIHERPSRRSAG